MPKISTAQRNSLAADLVADIGTSAQIELYDGTQPAGPDTGVTTQVLIIEFVGNASQFGTVSGGVITLSAVANAVGLAAGTPTWARIKTSGGTAIIDLTAGTDFTVSPSAIALGQTVTFNSGTITVPA